MQNLTEKLKSPFTWYGGKSRWTADVVSRMSGIEVYAEPFAGSLAVLLASPLHQREIVCDRDGMICNAWRAIQHEPELVAYWADYPTIHQDLTARRRFLAQWREENSEMLSQDPTFYCARAAGWWIWCLSNWIGPNHAMLSPTGDQIPRMANEPGGQGVQVQRIQLGRQVSDKRPLINISGGGVGVQVQRRDLGWYEPVGNGSRLIPWLLTLAQRLARVAVLNRDWTSAVTPTMLQQAGKSRKPPVGVFLDPPYPTEGRSQIYEDDTREQNPAEDAYKWAMEHGRTYSIAFCSREDDFPIPKGWEIITRSFGGVKKPERRDRQDLMMFSPACRQQTPQPKLL